jgi:type VI secretion system secreted protein VgrG
MPRTAYSQINRPIAVTTPLGPDTLLLVALRGVEAVSELFRFQLEMLAEDPAAIAFDRVLGQPIAVKIAQPDGARRYLHGIVSRISQGEQIYTGFGADTLTLYRAEVVPRIWLLSRRLQSRIFQQKSVPDILRAVFDGFDVVYKLQGTYYPRDYCVQYQESDLAFASRLMEEEGIFYFFEHTAKGERLIVGDTPQAHSDVPGPTSVVYKRDSGYVHADDRITDWVKTQELRSGKVTLWDYCFELPEQHLDASKPTQDSVAAGTVEHKLRVGRNEALELYEYRGGYAQRFDGVAPGGADRAGDLQHIFEDNVRTAGLRMQEEAARAVEIHGEGGCRHFVPGHKFSLEGHFDADGPYVLTRVEHAADLGDAYTTGQAADFTYKNVFTCIPAALPFRPRRVTPRPRIPGPQTAVVVGPPGEEIFTDKYSRVKVQFHWDREGKYDADSSCWVRVGSIWAGKQWGAIHIPRIGQEVIVAFEEGDPDQPIIVGSVYNAANMPPFGLPGGKVVSGCKSKTHQGSGYNEMTFDDTAGKEKITIHGQYDMNTTVEHDQTTTVHNNRTDKIDVDDSETVGSNQTIKIGSNQSTTVGAKQTLDVGSDQATTVGAKQTLNVGAAQENTIGAARTTNVGANDNLTVGGNQEINVSGEVSITSGKKITLTVGGSTITIDPSSITIVSKKVSIEGQAKVEVKGAAIASQATGVHELTGATIKLN